MALEAVRRINPLSFASNRPLPIGSGHARSLLMRPRLISLRQATAAIYRPFSASTLAPSTCARTRTTACPAFRSRTPAWTHSPRARSYSTLKPSQSSSSSRFSEADRSRSSADSAPALSSSSNPSTSAVKRQASKGPIASSSALPFQYDLTGFSKGAKKPSCENLGPKNSFYRRKLPEHLVSFTSPRGKELFRSMLAAGYGEGYFPLVGNFTTQSEPAYCGPSSLAMVLNSLEVDPRRNWKGAWRWYSDELLECCAPVEQVRAKGITFNQFACLSKCHCDVVVKRADKITFEEFKQDLEMVCSRDDIHMVVSFSRKALGQTGDGHFSPIGGYVPSEGMVLVLDTARFKYPSYFVSVEDLWKSLFPIDIETGSSRGYFLLSANPNQPAISLCKIPKSQLGPELAKPSSTESDLNSIHNQMATLSMSSDATLAAATTTDTHPRPVLSSCTSTSTGATLKSPTATSTNITLETSKGHGTDGADTNNGKMSWTSLAQTFCKDLPLRIQTENPQDLAGLIQVILRGVPREYAFWISQQQAHRLQDTQGLFNSVQSLKLYQLVKDAFPETSTALTAEQEQYHQQHEGALIFGTLFLMSTPKTLLLTLPSSVAKEFESLRTLPSATTVANDPTNASSLTVLKSEVEQMQSGIVELVNSFCACGTKV